ncbi:TPM domain-containing protein [Nitrosomonas sp.]|uniref:TPM domain-containing protein n=1 Tax=Nitrosomonas sp. TaxID=42353 RepID=UPI0025FE8DBB|nr:TPM domain-containing protein [Nitrosomonas sp.]
MNLTRIIRHLSAGQWLLRRSLPVATLTAIEQAIQQSETNHSGEICIAVECALNTLALIRNQTARERALEVFSQLRVWDTEQNNGVLIYLLLADRDVEIIVDQGIHAKVSNKEWENICHIMESAFRQQQFEVGLIQGIHAISQHLETHFPYDPNKDKNELTNKPTIL